MLKDQDSYNNSNVSERVSKAYSGRLRTRKSTDEKLMSYADDIPGLRNALSHCDKSRREKLLVRYTELTGIVVPEETEEEHKERISKAHSGIREPYWSAEKIMSYTDKDAFVRDVDASFDRFEKRVLARWAKLNNIPFEIAKDMYYNSEDEDDDDDEDDEEFDDDVFDDDNVHELKNILDHCDKSRREKLLAKWAGLHNVSIELAEKFFDGEFIDAEELDDEVGEDEIMTIDAILKQMASEI